jgi:hypothetical protein
MHHDEEAGEDATPIALAGLIAASFILLPIWGAVTVYERAARLLRALR